jgi:hypothetical protein
MPGGMNSKVRIWRYDYGDDDTVGGAQPTGTVAHYNLHARVEANPEDQLLLQQGLETVRTFNALIVPGSLDVRERDELEITAPTYHPYYNVRFRIVGVQFSSMDKYNPNNYMRLSMIRSVRSHGNRQ